MTRLLVAGASGLLGSNLCLTALDEGFDVVGTYHKVPVQLSDGVTMQADLSKSEQVSRVMEDFRPDWIINCAAMTNVDECERAPEAAMVMNRDLPGLLAEAARERNTRYMHISTDAVFDGETGGYQEADEPHPINAYGRTKLLGENAVLKRNPDSLVVRTNIFGWNALEKLSLAEWFLHNLQADETCVGFVDVKVSPILVTDLARLLMRALKKGLTGIYHIAGGTCLSKYDFGQLLAKAFDLDRELIRVGTSDSVGLTAKRGHNLCLKSEQIVGALGISLPDIAEGVQRFQNQSVSGYRDRLKRLQIS